MKYFVYCLKLDGGVVYIGSSTKIIDRLRRHYTNKTFDEVFYCQVKSEREMLAFEAYCIAKAQPILNQQQPVWNEKDVPNKVKWKKASLEFLRPSVVDDSKTLYMWYHLDFLGDAATRLGIPTQLLSDYVLRYKLVRGKVICVFDGTGESLSDFLHNLGCLEGLDEYIEHRYRQDGKVSLEAYERSIHQFD